MNFRQWLEDAGEVHPMINDNPYSEKGIKSKICANDKVAQVNDLNPDKMYNGKKLRKMMKKGINR